MAQNDVPGLPRRLHDLQPRAVFVDICLIHEIAFRSSALSCSPSRHLGDHTGCLLKKFY